MSNNYIIKNMLVKNKNVSHETQRERERERENI